jgi:hypothetical protein
MAYVGNPIDTQNTFQSLVGKRFNGDGSTTAFTLDVAPSSTLDLEVFVGNVRQDPNSAYTLSGTTLTFTGAPPSGTNNIYVVHQAKSVGTIDVPSGGVQAGSLNSAVLTGQTDIGANIADSDLFLVDDGAGGTLRKTAASRLKTYIGTSPITALNNATENELVTVGSTTTELDAEAKLISDGSGIIIRNAAVGTATSGKADMLVIEGNASGDTAGMSILTANDEFGVIHFGDGDDVDVGKIEYYHSSNYMRFYTNGSEQMRIPSDKGIFINTTSRTGSTNVLSVLGDSGEDVMHVRTSSDSGNINAIQFSDGDGVDNGEIVLNTGGNSTSYSTSSDYRLKENVTYDFDATSRLKQLKPSRFNWISKPDITLDGFLAHEVSSIVPEAINGTKDATKTVTNAVISKRNALLTDGVTEAEWEQGKIDGIYPSDSTWSASKAIPKYQSIDQSKLVPLLVKTVQELEARIKALEEA